MALTSAEKTRLLELNREISQRESAPTGLTPEEESRLEQINNELAERDKSYGEKGLDIAKDIYHLPRSFAKGAAQLADMVSYPIRKPLEQLVGRDIGTIEESLPQPSPKTAIGRIADKGAEFAGSMIGGGGLGKTATKMATYATPAIKSGLNKIGSMLGNPQSTKELATLGSVGAATGVTSGTLQEMGVNPILADVGSSIGVPIYAARRAFNAASPHLTKPKIKGYEKNILKKLEKRIGEEELGNIGQRLEAHKNPLEGYTPTTAEVAKNPALAQIERAYEGHSPALAETKEQGSRVIRETLEGIQPQNANIGSTQEHFAALKNEAAAKASKEHEKASGLLNRLLDPYLGKETREVIGQKLRDIVSRSLATRKGTLAETTQPLYEAVKSSSKGIETPTARNFIRNLIEKEGLVGGQKKKVESLLNSLESNTATKETKALYNQIQREFGDVSPHAMENILKQLGVNAPLPKPAQLDKVLSQIGEEISIAKRAGKHSTARHLMGLKEALLKDIELVAPEVSKARSTYAKLSKPVSEITRGKGLEKIVEQDIYKEQHKVGAAELPKLFLRGERSIENARNVMQVLKNDKEGRALLKQHVYEDFIRHVTDATGNINFGKVKTYIKNNPGAAIIDPNFTANIGKIEAAQGAFNKAQHNVTNSRYLGQNEQAFKNVLGPKFEGMDSHKVVESIFSGKNPSTKMEQIVSLASQNKKALEGLKHGTMDYVLSKINVSSPTPTNLKFLKQNKQTLSKILSKEEMELLNIVENIAKNRHVKESMAATKNSATAANLSILDELGKKWTDSGIRMLNKFTIIGGDISNAVQNARIRKRTQAMENFISNPDYAKSLLSRKKSLKEYKTIKESITRPIKSSIPLNLLKSHREATK